MYSLYQIAVSFDFYGVIFVECGYEVGSIVGGSVATPYSLPWQVGLVDPGKNRTWCGGTLIGPNHVLTASFTLPCS